MEVCNCEQMKKLMEPNKHTTINKFVTEGIIKNCPYCGKLNPVCNTLNDTANDFVEGIEAQDKDPVNHPSHYTSGRFETIEVIEDWKLDFCLGNAVKYISRAGKKDPNKEIEDLKKARWYIDRRIKQLEEEE